MAENRRFYYLKLKEGFYNSETMVVLTSSAAWLNISSSTPLWFKRLRADI